MSDTTDTITLALTFTVTGTKRQRVLAGLAIDDIVDEQGNTDLPKQIKELLAADGVALTIAKAGAVEKARRPRGPNKPKPAVPVEPIAAPHPAPHHPHAVAAE